MQRWRYTRGLHDIGNSCFAWLQPDGSFGWSNAGLVRGEDGSLLVDTLFDLRLTREMLEAMKDATAGAPIRTLVNTHANGDHCWGNQLLAGAEIVGSRACREEMLSELQPATLAALQESEGLGPGAEYLRARMRPFDFRGITVTPPTRVFEGRLTLDVAGTAVELIEVGPAHTAGDVLVHVPGARVVFTGDILFIDGTPIMWRGPVGNWIRACDLILELDPEVIVPGHGPITDRSGVEQVKDYLTTIAAEARELFDAGVPADEAARKLARGRFSTLPDRERIAVNVDTLYREFRGELDRSADIMALLDLMAELA
ncbi:MAG: MBL fold metallo-hydrolase [Candidatus Dadabacteria bacterium]|nr:MAG: MBL fold metallo-hydrolase [Candidatus Dadabacteria bacterium]